MALVRWLGQDDFLNRWGKWQRDMERLFNLEHSASSHTPGVYPPINIYDDGESYIARTEIPGVNPESLDITVTGDTLTIKGKRELDIDDKDKNVSFHRRERSFGEFRRAFSLPEQVDNTKVKATSSNGILEILLPRAEQAKQRKISVKTS